MGSLADMVFTNLSVKFIIILLKAYPWHIFSTLIILHLLHNKLRSGVRSLPGPALAGWTGLWRVFDVWSGDAHNTAINLHRRYGTLVRIGPRHVSIADPAEVGNIYGVKSHFTKTGFYPIFSATWKGKVEPNLFSTIDPHHHREQKRLVGNAFALSSLLEMEPAVDTCTQLFTSKLHTLAASGKPIDLGEWFQYYAFDVIGELCFAQKLGFLERGQDIEGMLSTISGVLTYSTIVGQIPLLHKFLLGNPFLPTNLESWDKVLEFTLKAINTRCKITRNGELEARSDQVVGRDMLSRWASIKIGDPTKLSTRDVVVHLSANVFGGSDATAIALRAILYLLLKNPEKMQKLMQQLDAADAAGKLSNPISYSESQTHLPYFAAVTKEAMRLHPSSGLLLERHVPPGGAKISGTFLPAGTVVGINPWVLHRDPQVFPDPEKFEPERWIESDEKKLAEMERSFFAFGAGARVCIGRHISMMEMAKVVPQLLREFTIELEHPEREWRVRNMWFVVQKGIVCRLVSRN